MGTDGSTRTMCVFVRVCGPLHQLKGQTGPRALRRGLAPFPVPSHSLHMVHYNEELYCVISLGRQVRVYNNDCFDHRLRQPGSRN